VGIDQPAHEHTHQHAQIDPALLGSEKGIQAIRVSLAGLLLTATFQAIVALAGGSAGLLADTLHNFADAFTAIPLWLAFALARRAANRRFTYGYGRAEDVAGALVLLFVILSAAITVYESYVRLVSRSQPTLIEWGIIAGLVGVAGNELVARYKLRVGREIGSAALEAEGQHSRIDGLTSLAAVAGLVGVRLGFPLADPLAGFVITFAILWIVWDVGREILGRLLDTIDPSTVDAIEQIAASVEDVRGVHDTRARWLGHEITVELHIFLDGSHSLIEAHAIGEQVRHELLHHIPRLHDAIVHMDPVEAERGAYHRETAHHFD